METDHGDLLVIKLSDGNCMTEHIAQPTSDQDWGDLAQRVSALMTTHHADKTATDYALADANRIIDELDANGISIDTCAVTQKSDIPPGNTAIPPTGQTLADMAGSDSVVSYPSA